MLGSFAIAPPSVPTLNDPNEMKAGAVYTAAAQNLNTNLVHTFAVDSVLCMERLLAIEAAVVDLKRQVLALESAAASSPTSPSVGHKRKAMKVSNQ
jgi:hypothetical protein